MFSRVLCVVITAQLLLPGICLAQNPGSPLSMRDAMQAAMETSPALKRFPFRREAVRGDIETVSLKPPLSVNAGVENALGTGDLSGFRSAEFTLGLSRVVELGHQRAARTDVAESRLGMVDTELEIAQLDLLAEVAWRFIDVVEAQEDLLLQQQARQLAQQTLTMIEPLVEAGRAPELELGRARAALNTAQVSERQAQTRLDVARVSLSTLWQSQTPEFSRALSDFYSVGEAGSLEALLLALPDNPSLAVYASEERLLQARLREAEARQSGSVQWTAGIRHMREVDDTGVVLGLSVPLGSRERSSGALRRSQAELGELDLQNESALNAMRGQLVALHLQLQQAIFAVNNLEADVLPLLSSVLDQTRLAYQAGNYSYAELVSAQRQYLEALQSRLASTASAHRLRIEIERLSGLPLTEQNQE